MMWSVNTCRMSQNAKLGFWSYFTAKSELFPELFKFCLYEIHIQSCSNSKNYYDIYSTTTLDYWKNIMIVLGSHICPIRTTRLLCVSLQWSWLNSKQQWHWIIGTFIMIVLQPQHVFSQVYYNSFLKKWLWWQKFSSVFFNPVLVLQ